MKLKRMWNNEELLESGEGPSFDRYCLLLSLHLHLGARSRGSGTAICEPAAMLLPSLRVPRPSSLLRHYQIMAKQNLYLIPRALLLRSRSSLPSTAPCSQDRNYFYFLGSLHLYKLKVKNNAGLYRRR
ncbi:hypothetical protein V2G26_016736 [Clonostachys chloroleuca]